MTRQLSFASPKCGFLCASLYLLACLRPSAVGFRAAPWVSRKCTRIKDTCVALAARRGEGKPGGQEREATKRINLAVPCSRKDALQSVSLGFKKRSFQSVHDRKVRYVCCSQVRGEQHSTRGTPHVAHGTQIPLIPRVYSPISYKLSYLHCCLCDHCCSLVLGREPGVQHEQDAWAQNKRQDSSTSSVAVGTLAPQLATWQ